MSNLYDIIIIGGGPAGLTSAVYGRRAGKSVLVIEKNTFGGQITWSPKVENFPTILSASGAEIGERMMMQAMEQGADLELEEVLSVRKDGEIFQVNCESGAEFAGRSLIIATGAKPRTLGIPREEELTGAGVCYCAVCDGAFFKGKAVAVNGGGNSALQDVLLLSESCSRVYLIHRRDFFRGEQALVDTLRNKDNVEFVLNASIAELLGEEELKGLRLDTGRILEVDGLFVAIGHQPQNEAFAELLALDAQGYAAAGEDTLTPAPGVFVAGDCRNKKVRQLTTAVADGAAAALAACSYLN